MSQGFLPKEGELSSFDLLHAAAVVELVDLYETGNTGYDIAEKFMVSPQTVYNWLRAAGVSVKHTRFKEGDNVKQVSFIPDTSDLGYVIGVLLGDGSLITKGYKISLKTIDREFAEEFSRALNETFPGINSGVKQYANKKCRNGQIYEVIGQSKTAFGILKPLYSVQWCEDQSKLVKQGVLLGLWDSEGCIFLKERKYINPYPKVQFGVQDKEIAELYAYLLAEVLGIEQAVWEPVSTKDYYVNLLGRDKAAKFFAIVNPTIVRKRERFERVVMACPN